MYIVPGFNKCVCGFLVTCRPVAIALYECDTLGDDKNLAFDEGEIIEVKTHTCKWDHLLLHNVHVPCLLW